MGDCLIIVKPLAICSIWFQDKLFLSIPENVEYKRVINRAWKKKMAIFKIKYKL